MPYPVSNLIEERGFPLCVKQTDKITDALSAMLKEDYSQLPVVDDENHPLGMITYGSILDAIQNLNMSLEKMVVENARLDTKDFDLEDDIFDLLKTLQETNAVLITSKGDQLVGIVTSYDTTEYFRDRSQDMMNVQEIENIIKKMILHSFRNDDGEMRVDELQSEINHVTERIDEIKKEYQAALNIYLSKLDQKLKFEQSAFEESLFKVYANSPEVPFDKLTLSDYIELLVNKDRWSLYQPLFKLEIGHVRLALDKVRQTRNDIAHFREITADQRKNLAFCKRLLERVQEELASREDQEIPIESDLSDVDDGNEFITPIGEETTTITSKYSLLGEYLQGIHGKKARIRIPFEEIERIIQDDLPSSAYTHQTWWSNDAQGHIHSRHWLDTGWRVGYINLTEKEVSFARMKERERAYIGFFGPLKTRLDSELDLKLKNTRATGANWIGLISVPESGTQLSIIPIGFANQNRYRIELYIDTEDKERNKKIFDDLKSQKEDIEASLGQPLGWERLDDKRASRIALYNTGSIDDGDQKLKELQDWTVEWLPKFYEALFERAGKAIKTHYL